MTEPVRLSEIASAYYVAGWHPLELPAGQKAPPPEGRTGRTGSNMTATEIVEAAWAGNIGLRMPTDVIGVDIDVYHGGDRTLNELLATCGALPNTWISHSGRNDGSGIRFYRVPPGLTWISGLAGLDVIQLGHRYAAVMPSVHPDGRRYGWINQADPDDDGLPAVEDLPELPWAWIGHLSRAQAADVGQVARAVDLAGLTSFLDDHNTAEQPSYVGTILHHFTERHEAGFSRHDTMQHCLIWAMENVRAGIAAARPTIAAFGDLWVAAVSPDTRRAQLWADHRTTEFEAMVRHAVGKVLTKPEAEILRLHDEIAGPPMRPAPELVQPARQQPAIFIDWTAFAAREDTDRKWLVEGFWPWGRAMALWAGAKTGKSELALWCAAKLALGEHPWTGEAVEPVDVAYFDYEMTEDDLDERLAAFDIDLHRLGRLHYALLPPLHSLDVETGGAEVEALVLEVGAKAAIIDTFGRAVAGDENLADTVNAFYRHTGSRLKRAGIGYLRTDHAGKDATKGQRGTSAKRDDVDVVWSMKRGEHGAVFLDCTGSSRLGWVGPQLRVDRSEINGALAYTSALRIGFPSGTAEKVKELDAVDHPLDGNKKVARAALRAAGYIGGANEVLAAALRFRRERATDQGADRLFRQIPDQSADHDG
jgi:hypothetical protein